MAEITDAVIDGLAAVRETGRTNMLDKTTVQRVAFDLDAHELVAFVEDASNQEYMDALTEMGERR